MFNTFRKRVGYYIAKFKLTKVEWKNCLNTHWYSWNKTVSILLARSTHSNENIANKNPIENDQQMSEKSNHRTIWFVQIWFVVLLSCITWDTQFSWNVVSCTFRFYTFSLLHRFNLAICARFVFAELRVLLWNIWDQKYRSKVTATLRRYPNWTKMINIL